MEYLQSRISVRLPLISWAISIFVCALAIYVWGHSWDWQITRLGVYQIFPLFGLFAFSLMWSQYLAAFLKSYSGTSGLRTYFSYTGYAVLVAILVHPSLLIVQLFRNGYGLPPFSYLNYVRPSLSWIVGIGSLSLFIFLVFELRRLLGDKPWWRFMNYAVDLAMIGIFYHGLRLGDQLHTGWFVYVWYFYGVALIAMLGYKYLVGSQLRRVISQ